MAPVASVVTAGVAYKLMEADEDKANCEYIRKYLILILDDIHVKRCFSI